MTPVIVYPKRYLTFLYLIGSLSFILAATTIWVMNPSEIPILLRSITLPSGVFFTVCRYLFQTPYFPKTLINC